MSLADPPIEDRYVILRQQLRDRIEEREKALRSKPRVNPQSKPLYSDDWTTKSKPLGVNNMSKGVDLGGVIPRK